MVVSRLPAGCRVDAFSSRPLDYASASQRATSAYRGPVASCPLAPLLLFATRLPAGCRVTCCRVLPPRIIFQRTATSRVQTMATACRAVAIIVDFVVRRAIAIVVDVVVRRAVAIIVVDFVVRRAVLIIVVDVVVRRAVTIIVDVVVHHAVAIAVVNFSKAPHSQID